MNTILHLELLSEDLRDAARELVAIEAQCSRHETPCGEGHMVWRRWGEGPPVVLIHGGGGSWLHWARNIEALARHHTVWAPDSPGQGDSASPHEITVEAIGEAVVDGMRRVFPGETTFDLVSFSFGGPVSAYAATRLGRRIHNYVPVSSRFVLVEGKVFPDLVQWKHLKDPVEILAAHRRNLELMMIADPARIDDMALLIQSTNTPRARYHGPSLQPGEKFHRYLREVSVSGRITAISGRNDHLAKAIIPHQEAALQAMHPGARFHIIEGAGHWVQFEAADEINPLILDALASSRGA